MTNLRGYRFYFQDKSNNKSRTEKKAREDEKIRNRIEGKLGEGKRRYGLNRIMAKLPETSETVIAMSFLVMNLAYLYRQVLRIFLWLLSKIKSFGGESINSNYYWLEKQQETIIIASLCNY